MTTEIKVNWAYVETAFERNSPDLNSFIDRETGEVVVVVDGQMEDEQSRRRIAENPGRYVRIDPASSREQYRWMEQFVTTVDDPQLRERLLVAIDGKGAFRRFKDVLLSYPQERDRWFNYRALLLHHHINKWFETKDLEPVPAAPWGAVELPPEPQEPMVKNTQDGQGIADMLRKQVKSLVDILPACELHTARTFLEYLRDRGGASLTASASNSELLGSHNDGRDPRDARGPRSRAAENEVGEHQEREELSQDLASTPVG